MLATLGSGGEAQVVKALDRQHDRFVALKIRPVRDDAAREELLGEARVLLALPPHPALPLVREDFFDGDDYVVAMDWVDGTDLATLLRRARAPRARAVERARLPRPGGRGAHAPALAGPAGHPRRRQARQPHPHQGRPDQARRLRPVVGAGRAAPARRHAGLPRPGAGRRRQPRRARATSTRSPRPRSRCSPARAPAGVLPVVGGHRRRRRPSSSRPRSGSAWRPTRRAARRPRASSSSGCAPAGRPRCRPAW